MVEADPEATEPASTPSPSGEASVLQAAAVEALFAAKTHNSAAEQMEETTWTLAEGELRIQTSLSKQLMGTIFRPEVEAIVKGALRSRGATGLRVVFVPGNLEAKVKAPKKAAHRIRAGQGDGSPHGAGGTEALQRRSDQRLRSSPRLSRIHIGVTQPRFTRKGIRQWT